MVWIGYRYPTVYVIVIVIVIVRIEIGGSGGKEVCVNHNSIADTLWTDSEFRRLSVNGKVLFLCLLTAPVKSYTGIFFATAGTLSEYCSISKQEASKAIAELCERKFIVSVDDHLIICNHMKFNTYGYDTHKIRMVKDLNALQESVFSAAMAIPIIKSTYQNACEVLNVQPRMASANDPASEPLPFVAAVTKPVVKQSLTPASDQFAEASEMIKRLRSYALAIFDEIGSSKNKPELTTEQYQKLIDKWGFDKLVVMQRAFYDHVSKLEKKYSYNHFNVLIKGGWVLDKVNKLEDAELDMKNGSGKW